MTRKIIEACEAVDTSRLYGDIDGAILYLQELRERCGSAACLYENWTGYADMQMSIVYNREENDEEYTRRRANEEWEKEQEARCLAKIEEERLKERSADLKKYNELKEKLGL